MKTQSVDYNMYVHSQPLVLILGPCLFKEKIIGVVIFCFVIFIMKVDIIRRGYH